MDYDIREMIVYLLGDAIGYEYARNLADDEEFSREVIEDVYSSSAWEDEHDYNDDDVSLAIGRVLMYRLGIWC